MEALRIALIQSNIHWHQTGKNLQMFSEKIYKLTGPVDLLVLPEMFSTGFSMDAADQAEKMDGKTIQWMKQMAKSTNAAIAGSVIIEENQSFFNRLIWMQPDGHCVYYDKRHLFRFAGEDAHYTQGTTRQIVKWRGWKICLNVCYDLRFPVWSRNRNDYDVLLYVANWPSVRSYPWITLLRARAIENLSYVIGVNRIGYDGLGNYFSGDSALIFADGKAILECSDEEMNAIVVIEKPRLEAWRKQFQFALDADEFEIKI